MTGCAHAHLDGAYVLGALAPEERLDFERHLTTCPSCADAVRELAGLPGLLAQVAPEVLESTPEAEQPPPTLLPALVREVRRSQHRRRWAAGLVAAAVVALAVGLGAALATVAGGDGAPPPAAGPSLRAARDMTQVGQHGVAGDLAVTPVAWGTRLDLTCRYEQTIGAYGAGAPATYALVVRTRDGRTERVATWRALPGRTMRVTGATALSTAEIAAVEVRTGAGQRVLELAG